MANRVLIDSSAWIDALREDGDPSIRNTVRDLTADGLAVFCDIVRLELWNGAGGVAEAKMLRGLEREIECVPTTAEVWQVAFDLARDCRARGITVPATDLLVAACAARHGLALLHHDALFDQIARVSGGTISR